MNLEILEYTSSGVYTNKTDETIRFKLANDAVVDTADPLHNDGQTYTYTFTSSPYSTSTYAIAILSYSKVLGFNIDSLEGGSYIDNIKVVIPAYNWDTNNNSQLWYIVGSTYYDPYDGENQLYSPPYHEGLQSNFNQVSNSGTTINVDLSTQHSSTGVIGKYLYLVTTVDVGATTGTLSSISAQVIYDVN